MHRWHGGAQAGRIVWTQVLDSNFTTARLVSARPDGSGFRILTHPARSGSTSTWWSRRMGARCCSSGTCPADAACWAWSALAVGECSSSLFAVRTPARGWPIPAGRRTACALPSTRVMGPFDGLGQWGPLSRAVYRPPGRKRDAPSVTARHRRRLRGLPRPVRRQRQTPDLPTAPQPAMARRRCSGCGGTAPVSISSPRGDWPPTSPTCPWPPMGRPGTWWSSKPSGQAPPKGSKPEHRDRPSHLPPAGGLRPRDPLRHAQRRPPARQLQPVVVTRRAADRLHRGALPQPESRRWATSGRYGPTAATRARYPSPRGFISGPTGAA